MSITERRIVIVDDDPVMTRLLSRALTKHGYESMTTIDPTTTLHHARAFKPSLIVLDFDMPNLDGSDVAVLLKSAPETKTLPIVFLSALDDEEHRDVAQFAGAVTYLRKPIQTEEFIRAIETLLGGRTAAE